MNFSVSGGFIDSPQISTRPEAAYRIYAFDIFHPAVVRPPRRMNPRILSAHSKKYILRVQLPAASPHSGMGWHDERRRGVHVTVRAVGPGRRGSRLKVFSPKGPIDNESLLVCERRRKTGGLFLFPSDSLVLQEVLKFHKLKSLRTSSNPI